MRPRRVRASHQTYHLNAEWTRYVAVLLTPGLSICVISEGSCAVSQFEFHGIWIPQRIFPEAEASSHMQSTWCALSCLGKSQSIEIPTWYRRLQNSNDVEFSWFLQIFTYPLPSWTSLRNRHQTSLLWGLELSVSKWGSRLRVAWSLKAQCILSHRPWLQHSHKSQTWWAHAEKASLPCFTEKAEFNRQLLVVTSKKSPKQPQTLFSS